MAHFKTWDASGKNLVDSNYIAMGLVKSGYMVKLYDLQRKARPHFNSPDYEPVPYYDAVHGFTVTAQSPLVFIAGRGVLQQIQRSGNSFTFTYAHASTSTRFYVFDLMHDRGGAGAKMRLWDDLGVCTLDSSMPFLDIDGAATSPPPTGGRVYAGATTETGRSQGNQSHENSSIVMDLYSVSVGGDCAACAPWNRGMFHWGLLGAFTFSAVDGAYGSGGDLVFIAATEAGCHINQVAPTGFPAQFYNIPSARLPTVTYINAATLPIPFG